MAAVPAYSSQHMLGRTGCNYQKDQWNTYPPRPTWRSKCTRKKKKKKSRSSPFSSIPIPLVFLFGSLAPKPFCYCTVWRPLAVGGGLFSHPQILCWCPEQIMLPKPPQRWERGTYTINRSPGEGNGPWGVDIVLLLFLIFLLDPKGHGRPAPIVVHILAVCTRPAPLGHSNNFQNRSCSGPCHSAAKKRQGCHV